MSSPKTDYTDGGLLLFVIGNVTVAAYRVKDVDRIARVVDGQPD